MPMPNWNLQTGNAASFVLQLWVFQRRSFGPLDFRQGMVTDFDIVVPQEEVEQFLETWINELHGQDIYACEGGAYFPKEPEGDLNLANMEKKMILAAMKKTNNNQTEAATLLGIGRSALRHRLKKIGYKAT